MNGSHLAAALGFAFAVVWATLGFGEAVGCLAAAVGFWLAWVLVGRAVDLGEVQRIFAQRRS